MGIDIVVGGLVWHEQLGLGKVIEITSKKEAVVAFLFFWPAVVASLDALSPYSPSALFRDICNYLPKLETKGQLIPQHQDPRANDLITFLDDQESEE